MQQSEQILLRNADPTEFTEIGKLLVRVYSQLDGFPKQTELPAYYRMLTNVGDLTQRPGTDIIVAVAPNGQLLGAVVFFSDMQYYGSGEVAMKEQNSAGFRLLGVDATARKQGVGKMLAMECINRAMAKNLRQVIIHTTKAMMTAWKMYEDIGFKRSDDLDFMQGELPIFGFRFTNKP